jgi:hypothetical protein
MPNNYEFVKFPFNLSLYNFIKPESFPYNTVLAVLDK